MASSTRRRRTAPQSAFRSAVEAASPPVSKAYAPGIQALQRSHRRLVSCPDGDRITGSIDLDSALQAMQPNAPRWDYGIGYRLDHREHAVWIEVHSAQTSKVREVLRKLRWLKDWLASDGVSLQRLTTADGPVPAFVWIASGSNRLPSTTRQAKLAAQEGVYPRKRLQLP